MPLPKEALALKVRAWAQPIAPDAPAGKPAKLESIYEEIQKEVSKLEAMSAGSTSSVNWELVVDKGGQVLEKISKDLLVASYVSYGLYVTNGFEGLSIGLSVLTDMMDQYWPQLFPEVSRVRGRVNALGWLVTRLGATLPDVKVRSQDKDALEALAQATARLLSSTKAKFENNAPAMGPLVEAVERLKLSLPKDAPPPQETPASDESSSSNSSQPAVSTAPILESLPPANADDPLPFLRQVGASLTQLADTLRKVDPSLPLPYRLMRIGIWLPILQAPIATGAKTMLAPLPAGVRAQLDTMAANSKWNAVLDEAEGQLAEHRFNLDLQRFTAQALRGLGPAYTGARELLIAELAAFLRRLPSLIDLCAQDGTPFADGETRAWIEAEVKANPGGGAAQGESNAGLIEKVGEARALLAQGQPDAGLVVLQEQVTTAKSGRERFLARFELAKLCAASGQKGLGQALLEALDEEISQGGLDAWDPKLAAECLEQLLSMSKAQALKAGGNAQSELLARYRRLCQLDPSAAMRVAL